MRPSIDTERTTLGMSKGSRSRRRKERDKRPAGGNGEARRASASDAPSETVPSSSNPTIEASVEEAKPAAEAYHEDAFFARGEENGSVPPSSVDAPDVEIDEIAQRRRRP